MAHRASPSSRLCLRSAAAEPGNLVKAFASDHFVLPLPEGHRFPMAKYRLLRERVATELPEVTLLEAPAASDTQLALAHDSEYIERATCGRLCAAELRAIGFPWSEAMVERSRRSVGATIAACRSALREGVGASLAGGTHHAQHARGAGYCVFNDAAIAVRQLQAEVSNAGGRLRVAIIDLDVHQGDGTAQILAGDPTVFTLSLHGASNFPFRKQQSSLDIGLPDGTGDDEYLFQLDLALAELEGRFAAQFILFTSGADPHEDDRLGRLRLTSEGIAQRDRRVYDFAERLGIPLAVTMAGGYGREVDTTVDIHWRTVRGALHSWRSRRGAATPHDDAQ
jgi:acetoin utilization deacetylase AcuC-like enzyme